ncbi:unnamed protein product, partial [marine sediment metagenome]
KFIRNYNRISQRHRIDVKEIESNELDFSKKVKWGCTIESAKITEKGYYFIGPDGKEFKNCYDIMEYYK